MKWISLFTLGCLLWCPGWLGAQSDPDSPLLPWTQEGFVILEDYVQEGENNIFSLTQQGDLHEAQAIQDRQQQAGDPNLMEVTQRGSGHEATLTQEGVGNQSRLVQQGNGHTYVLLIDGDDNRTDVQQVGSDNRIEQTLTGDGMQYRLRQAGHDNELIQVENGVIAPAYQVDQTGSGMRLIIENSNIYLPQQP